MRSMVEQEPGLVYAISDSAHSRELKNISDILDAEPAIVKLVYDALVAGGGHPGKGPDQMTAEQVVRCLIIKQMHGLSYRRLRFTLCDSNSAKTFCRFGIGDKLPSKSALQRDIKTLSATCLEAVNQVLVRHALACGIERDTKVRIDCTVTETNIHAPTDSSLLLDCVRVLSRLVERARERWALDVPWVNHTRIAKRLELSIEYARRGVSRADLYKKLIKVTRTVMERAKRVVGVLRSLAAGIFDNLVAEYIANQLEHFFGLAERVTWQAERRAVFGEQVESKDKLVSIFETHTDIIKKDKRETCYGHKVCLSVGQSLVLDAVIEDGNPADATLAVPMVSRLALICGRVPNKVVFDGGFASRANLEEIKAAGVVHVVFTKGKGISREEMTPSVSIYRHLRRFRAGVESAISCLKRAFGLTRCTWTGADGFATYVWGSVLASNLLKMARLMTLG